MSRYFALLGGNDPLAWFLGKNDKAEYEECNHPDEIRTFDERSMPTLGDNGFFIWRDALVRSDLDNFSHIDNQLDLVKLGYNKFYVASNSIIHDTGEIFFKYLRKRYHYTSSLYFKELKNRRYHVVKNSDYPKVCLFILYSISGLSIGWSIRKFVKLKDKCVFIHPLMCIGLCIVYFLAVVNNLFKKGGVDEGSNIRDYRAGRKLSGRISSLKGLRGCRV